MPIMVRKQVYLEPEQDRQIGIAAGFVELIRQVQKDTNGPGPPG